MNNKVRVILAVAAAFAATIGSASQAATVAMQGTAQQPSQAHCFANSGGSITNTCDSVGQFCMSNPISSSGYHAVSVVGYRPNGGTFTCHAASLNSMGQIYSVIAARDMPVVNTNYFFELGNLYIPDWGAAYICCDLSKDATIRLYNL